MTNNNTTDGEQHFFANDGTDWRSTAGPVSTKEAREVDEAQDVQGDGPAGTNDLKLGWSVVEGSESQNNDGEVTEGESDEDESDEDESDEDDK